MEGVLQLLCGLPKFLKLPWPLNFIFRLASFTLLFATILLFLLVGFSLTIINSITIINISAVNSVDPILTAITELQFGVWGVCATIVLNTVEAQRACYGPQLGYIIPTSLLALVGLSSKLVNVAETSLLTLLVLHLVCTALSITDFTLLLFFHSHIVTIIVAIATAFFSTVIFAVDAALVVSVRNNVNSLFSGGDFVVTFGNGVWMILTAMILSWIVVILLSAQRRCGVICPQPNAPDSVEDSIEKATI